MVIKYSYVEGLMGDAELTRHSTDISNDRSSGRSTPYHIVLDNKRINPNEIAEALPIFGIMNSDSCRIN